MYESKFIITNFLQVELAFAYGCGYNLSTATLVEYIQQSGIQNTLHIKRLGKNGNYIYPVGL